MKNLKDIIIFVSTASSFFWMLWVSSGSDYFSILTIETILVGFICLLFAISCFIIMVTYAFKVLFRWS